jgi:dCMP deaminase
MDLNTDECFMYIALLYAKRSKDPSTKVGAVIVNAKDEIVTLGYNSMPDGARDGAFPWGRGDGKSDMDLTTKYPYVVHAERNAIINALRQENVVTDCRIYVSLFPCNECAKEIVQSGIKEVVYLSDKYAADPKFIASRKILTECGIKLRQMKLKGDYVIDLNV